MKNNRMEKIALKEIGFTKMGFTKNIFAPSVVFYISKKYYDY